MSCREVHEQLVHYLYHECSATEQRAVEDHLHACNICQEEHATLRRTLQALDLWEVPAMEPFLVPSAVGPVKATWRPKGSFLPGRPFVEPLISIGCGTLWALASLLLLKRYLDATAFPPLVHLLLGVFSGGLFAGLSHLALWGSGGMLGGRLGMTGWSLKVTARAALLTIGLTCLAFYAFPPGWVFQWGGLDSSLALGYFVVGGSYAALAALVAGLLTGKGLGRTLLPHAILAACFYVVVMAPGLALICTPFGLAVYLSLLAGSAFGGVMGALGGFWVAWRI